MANICEYKVMVKGKKSHCYAMLGVLPKYDDNCIIREEGTNDDYTLVFSNTCAWALTARGNNCVEYEGEPLEIPEDPYEAERKFDGDFWQYTIASKSKIFDVEIWYNSGDIDEMIMQEHGHYLNGRFIDDEYPDELKLDMEVYIEGSIETLSDDLEQVAKQIFKTHDKETIAQLVNYMVEDYTGECFDSSITEEDFAGALFAFCASESVFGEENIMQCLTDTLECIEE